MPEELTIPTLTPAHATFLAQVFDRPRSGLSMELEEGGETEEQSEVEEPSDPPADAEVDETDPPADEEKEGEEKKELSHEDALSALTKTRSEAANWRTKYRELETKLSDAKSPEQVEEIVTQMTAERETAEQELVLENVALKHKLDDELTGILREASKGKKREELEAHAATLAKYLPTTEKPKKDAADLAGGLDPTDAEGDAFDPVAAARKARNRRY